MSQTRQDRQRSRRQGQDQCPGQGRGQGPSNGREGFTLVEMLVVIFILVILVSLIVGVGKVVWGETSKKQTQTWQKVVAAAVEQYYTLKHVYPRELTRPEIGTKPTPPSTDYGANLLAPEWDALLRSENLHKQLTALPRCAEVIGKVPEAIYDRLANSGGGTNNWPILAFQDAWGQVMDYRVIGGRPIVISAGPDKYFGDPASPAATPQGATATNAELMKDNIRSDSQ